MVIENDRSWGGPNGYPESGNALRIYKGGDI